MKLPDQNILLVLHQMGSHGPEYFKRSNHDQKHFKPECRNKQLDECSSEQIRNAYDNTIVTTDSLLAGIIRAVKNSEQSKSVSLLYVSDHGESLGETGLYLHGMPYMIAPRQQTEVPMIFWSNSSYRKQNGIDKACVTDLKDNKFSHDNFFPTALGLLRIETKVYKKSDDIFSTCRKSGDKLSPSILSMRNDK